MSKLGIYLNDHYAASVAAVELARRAAQSNRGTACGELLATLAAEIEEDRQTLRLIMQRLGIRVDPAKAAVAWSAELLQCPETGPEWAVDRKHDENCADKSGD